MQTLAQILAGSGGNPYEPSAPGGGMSPLIQMLMQAQQGQGMPQQDMGMGANPALAQGGPGGIPQTQIPIPGQPQLPGIGSMGQPMGLGAAAGYGSGIF